MSTGKSPFEVVQRQNLRNSVETVVKIKRDKQNIKTIEFVKKFIKTQDIWKKINPNMK
jgi:hypothetical protein